MLVHLYTWGNEAATKVIIKGINFFLILFEILINKWFIDRIHVPYNVNIKKRDSKWAESYNLEPLWSLKGGPHMHLLDLTLLGHSLVVNHSHILLVTHNPGRSLQTAFLPFIFSKRTFTWKLKSFIAIYFWTMVGSLHSSNTHTDSPFGWRQKP